MALTFGGEAILGDHASTNVLCGTPTARDARYTMPGVNGTFLRRLGHGSRRIVVQATLRTEDEAAMVAIEQRLDQLVLDRLPGDLVDGFGRTWTNCVLLRWEPQERRTTDRGDGEDPGVWQAGTLWFEELTPQVSVW